MDRHVTLNVRQAYRASPISALLRELVKRSPRELAIAISLLFAATLSEGLSALLLIPVVRLFSSHSRVAVVSVKNNIASRLVGTSVSIPLEHILLAFVALIAIRALLIRFKDIYLNGYMYDFLNGLRRDLFGQITKLRWDAYIRLRNSDLNHALTADIDRVQVAAIHSLQLCQTVIVLLVYGITSLVISPGMTCLAIGIGAVMLIATTPIRRAALRYGSELTRKRRDEFRIVSDFLSGVKLAKATNAEPIYVARLAATLNEMRSMTIRFIRVTSMTSVSFQVFSAIGLAVFVYAASTFYQIGFGSIGALIILFGRLSPRLMSVHTSAQEVMVNAPALTNMLSIQDHCKQNSEAAKEPSGRSSIEFEDSIEFRSVSFSYAELPILKSVSFTIRAKETTAIIGPSGSGKSTIADLIAGLLLPHTGSVLVDGIALEPQDCRTWRDSVAYVAQDSFLLHDTIRGNLTFGIAPIGDDDIWIALNLAGATQLVEQSSAGLDTIVGDHGIRLSGGERQRIALARAILRKPKLLILDEATSALDWENQAIVAQSIRSLSGHMTVVTIAHRPSMIAFADTVISIDNGEIVETGNYAILAEIKTSRLAHLLRGDR
jgi:ATP-binding cassette subfamily C protein